MPSFSFFLPPSSVNSLGISDELKQKLQDVMVDRHKLTLGKTLGEGRALFLGQPGVKKCTVSVQGVSDKQHGELGNRANFYIRAQYVFLSGRAPMVVFLLISSDFL